MIADTANVQSIHLSHILTILNYTITTHTHPMVAVIITHIRAAINIVIIAVTPADTLTPPITAPMVIAAAAAQCLIPTHYHFPPALID
jgi:hypothetical protein